MKRRYDHLAQVCRKRAAQCLWSLLGANAVCDIAVQTTFLGGKGLRVIGAGQPQIRCCGIHRVDRRRGNRPAHLLHSEAVNFDQNSAVRGAKGDVKARGASCAVAKAHVADNLGALGGGQGGMDTQAVIGHRHPQGSIAVSRREVDGPASGQIHQARR